MRRAGREAVGRAGAAGVAVALLVGGLGGCAWEDGVVTAPTTTSTGPPAAEPAPPPPPPAEEEGPPATTTTALPATTTTAPPATTTTAPPAGARTHVIQPGDNLYALAQANGVSLQAIVAANPGVDPGDLRVGSTLVIPPAG